MTDSDLPSGTIVAVEEHEVLVTPENRQAYWSGELSDEWVAAIASASLEHIDPKLDTLLV